MIQALFALTLAAATSAAQATAAAAPAPPREQASWAERTLATLTLREKVAQMVMPWVHGEARRGGADWRRSQRLVAEEKVGGVIVGAGAALRVAEQLNELQRASRVPLLVAADLEWGAGARLGGATRVPVQMALAAAGDPSYAYEAGRITGKEARAGGIHLALAPVADVNVNPANPVINTRSFGADPELVAERVAAFIRGARAAGLLTVAKHFPGHGDTDLDSHVTLPTISVGRQRLRQVELVPFRAAIRAGVFAVMTAHVAVPALEPGGLVRPATLSPRVVTNLLRRDLGFQGLVITDALNMDAVRKREPVGEAAVQAVEAGADVLLMPPNVTEAIDAVVRAVEAGRLTQERIDQSVLRILKAKEKLKLNQKRLTEPKRLAKLLAEPERALWAERAAERSMTLVRAGDGALPLYPGEKQILVIEYDDGRDRALGDAFRQALAERGATVDLARLWKSSEPEELEEAECLAAAADVVIFSTYTRAVPWKGELGLPAGIAALAERLAAAGALVLSFGDPYLLSQVPSAGTYLLAWSEDAASQRAAARALTGEISVTGRLPVPLPPFHALGDGILLPSLASIEEADGTEVALPRRQR